MDERGEEKKKGTGGTERRNHCIYVDSWFWAVCEEERGGERVVLEKKEPG